MTTVARIGIALVVFAAALTVTGTAGTTAVSADRSALVATGADDEAALGIEPLDPTVENGRQTEVPLLVLSNRFPGDLDAVRVTITAPDERPPRLLTDEWNGSLPSGESATVTADVVCGGRGQFHADWTLSIAAIGPDTEILAMRTVTVTCAGLPDPPDRPGNGPDSVPKTGSPGESVGAARQSESP